MRVCRLCVFLFSLLQQFVGATGATGHPVVPPDQPEDSGISLGPPTGHPVVPPDQPEDSGISLGPPTGDSVVPPDQPQDSGISAGTSITFETARYSKFANDIYSHSGGVRVLMRDLSPDGMAVLSRFMADERREQRAFIWQKMGLGNINFVHTDENTSWVAQRKEPTPIKNPSADSQIIVELSEPEYHHVSMEHVDNVNWNLDNISICRDAFLNDPLYSDKPGSAEQHHSDPVANIAYNDPHYSWSDAVVNYRINTRALVTERVGIFVPFDSTLQRTLSPLNQLNTAVEIAERLDRGPRSNDWMQMLKEELRRRGPATFDIDVNVDSLELREDMYKVIWGNIEAEIARVYQESARSMAPTAVLKEIADKETAMAKKYQNFNDPRSGDMKALDLDSSASMHDNIEKVYQRALVRRAEFHKLTEPVVVTGDLTYRVHYTDPEERYTTGRTAGMLKPKKWYQSMWKYGLESIFKDVVIQEFTNNRLRNIVLVYDKVPQSKTNAYVDDPKGENIIIHCVNVASQDFAENERTLRHEFEHTIDTATEQRTRELYEAMRSEADLSTYTKENFAAKLSDVATLIKQVNYPGASKDDRNRLSGLIRRQNLWTSLRDKMDAAFKHHPQFGSTFNVDYNGFPTIYARASAAEAVAEMRSGMRHEPTRLAFLRRMTLYETDTDAGRLKQFYDNARQVMEEYGVRELHKSWGENYDNVDRESWGLLPDQTKQVDKHYQIMALDGTRATRSASDSLATHFLQRGYDVTMMGYKSFANGIDPFIKKSANGKPVALLQSNLKDPPNGHTVQSVLYVVGGTKMRGQDVARRISDTFDVFTPTGRCNEDNRYKPNFKEVFVVRPPADSHLGTSSWTSEQFVTDLGQALSTDYRPHFQGGVPRISTHDGVINDRSIWPEDKRLYRRTIHEGLLDAVKLMCV